MRERESEVKTEKEQGSWTAGLWEIRFKSKREGTERNGWQGAGRKPGEEEREKLNNQPTGSKSNIEE